MIVKYYGNKHKNLFEKYFSKTKMRFEKYFPVKYFKQNKFMNCIK